MFWITEGNRPPRLPLLRHTACYLEELVKVRLIFTFRVILHVDMRISRFITVYWRFHGLIGHVGPDFSARSYVNRAKEREKSIYHEEAEGQQKCPGKFIKKLD